MIEMYNSATVKLIHDFVHTDSMLNVIKKQYDTLYDFTDDAGAYRVLVICGKVKNSFFVEQVSIHMRVTESGTEINLQSLPATEGIFRCRQYSRSKLLECIVKSFKDDDCIIHYLTESQCAEVRKAWIKSILLIIAVVLISVLLSAIFI